MNTFHRFCLAALCASLPATGAIGASRVMALNCPGCTKAQVAAMAVRCDKGYSYVSDFPGGKLYKVCQIDGNGHAKWQQPGPQYLKDFQAFLNVYRLNGHHMYVRARVRADIPMPATTSAAAPRANH
jgi:hypothetical protein